MPKEQKKILTRNLKIFLSVMALIVGVISLYGTNPFGLDAVWGNALILLSFAGFAWVIFYE